MWTEAVSVKKKLPFTGYTLCGLLISPSDKLPQNSSQKVARSSSNFTKDGSRIRKEKVAFSSEKGYVRTGPKSYLSDFTLHVIAVK